MAKTTAPLLSFGASGSLAKTAVYGKWRGIPYVRRHVVPANPNTLAQQTTRNTFATLREMFKVMPAEGRLPWDAFASGRPFTGMNSFVGENMRVLRGDLNMSDLIGSPGAGGGLSILGVTLAAGTIAGQIIATVDVGTPPAGWTVQRAVALGVQQQDPADRLVGPVVVGTDAASPYAITLAGFAAASQVVVSAWAVWTTPEGRTAYSVSRTATGAAF